MLRARIYSAALRCSLPRTAEVSSVTSNFTRNFGNSTKSRWIRISMKRSESALSGKASQQASND